MLARKFATEQEAAAFAATQEGLVFKRWWSLEELIKGTSGFAEAYAEGQPWAVRLHDSWVNDPLRSRAHDEAPADRVYSDERGYYVGLAMRPVLVEAEDAPTGRIVQIPIPMTPADPLAEQVDCDVFAPSARGDDVISRDR